MLVKKNVAWALANFIVNIRPSATKKIILRNIESDFNSQNIRYRAGSSLGISRQTRTK